LEEQIEEAEEEAAWISLAQGDRIIGQDAQFLKVLDNAHRIAGYDISVLIRGETGTGKDLIARFIHERGSRSGQPYASVNCAAIGASLAESELFGHLKGAFTGADRDRPGKFRSADGGAILLDEVGDLPPEIQPKLLRVLEKKTLIPVGADREVTVDVRILAATNQDLEKLIDEGRFRRDLYERLNQVTLRLPPLRERRTDIPLLVRAFLAHWNAQYKEEKRITEEAMRYLLEYPWPGNVRELQNSISSMCAMALSEEISAELLPQAVLAHFNREPVVPGIGSALPPDGLNLKALLFQVERQFYEKALGAAEGNREQAARLLGLNAPAFRKALRERFGDLAED
jgi:transcriptional regulator with GAF, ATPase, and Fis domain